jgi:DNA polymerase lambda
MEVFKHAKIGILSGFSGFTKMSSDVISRNIIKQGGIIYDLPMIRSDSNDLDCLIVPENATLSKILEVLQTKKLPLCQLVTPAWAIDSIKEKKMLPFENFGWVQIELPIKREMIENHEEVSSKYSKNSNLRSNFRNFSSPEIIRNEKKTEVLDESLGLNKNLPGNRDIFQFEKEQSNQNDHITSVLEVLRNNYALLRDKGRTFAYRSAIISLKSHPEKITSVEQVENLQKVGSKIKKKIGEILETGTLKRVQAMDELERLKCIKEFSKIWGIGSTTADKLFSMGYKSIADLKKKIPTILNENQKIGLELYEELLQRIPREEVKVISELVITTAKDIIGETEIITDTCGSYRRGKQDCGDIDILITFDDFLLSKDFLLELISTLKEKGIVTHVLVMSIETKKHENLSFEGIAKLPGRPHRRLDIKIYPRKFYAWALMHFTGSANFNRDIRLLAKKKGLKLTDEGLFPALRVNGETYCGANLVDCYTEEEIFSLLDIPYKPPEERDL